MMITEEVLRKLGEKFGLMLNWSNENVIPYLKELSQRVIQYEYFQSIFWLILGIICIIISIIFAILAIKVDSTFWLLTIIIGIIGIAVIGTQINDMLLCKYLPEKILIRFINNNG